MKLYLLNYLTRKILFCYFTSMSSSNFKFVHKIMIIQRLSSDINAIIGLNCEQALKIPVKHHTNDWKWLFNIIYLYVDKHFEISKNYHKILYIWYYLLSFYTKRTIYLLVDHYFLIYFLRSDIHWFRCVTKTII